MSEIQYRESPEQGVPRIIGLEQEFIDFHKIRPSAISKETLIQAEK